MTLFPVLESKIDTIPKLDAVARYFPSILKVAQVFPFCVNLCTRFRFNAFVLLLNSTSHAEYRGLSVEVALDSNNDTLPVTVPSSVISLPLASVHS